MKKKILTGFITLTVISSLVFLMSFKSSVKEENYIIVRVFEYVGGVMGSGYVPSIKISDGTTIKSIALEEMKPKNDSENALRIAKALNDIKNQGYVLVSSNGGAGTGYGVTNYIFEKK